MNLEHKINNSYNELSTKIFESNQNFFNIKLEDLILSAGFFKKATGEAAKARNYTMSIMKDWRETITGAMHRTGMETQRSDSSEITKDIQEKVTEIICKYSGDIRINKLVNYITNTVNKLKMTSPVKFGIPSAIQKQFDEYKHKPIQVKSALNSRKFLDIVINPPAKPYRVPILEYKANGKFIKTDNDTWIAFENEEDIKDKVKYDWKTIVNKTITSKIGKLLDPFSISLEKIIEPLVREEGQKGIDSFFGGE